MITLLTGQNVIPSPYVKLWLWNAAKPFVNSDGDHGPYELLPQERVAITSADPQRNRYRDVYRNRVAGKTLALKAVSHADPTETKAKVRLGKILLLAFAAAPLGEATTAQDRRLVGSSEQELVDQPRLPDTRGPDDGHEAAHVSGHNALEGGVQKRELLVSSDDRRRRTIGRRTLYTRIR